MKSSVKLLNAFVKVTGWPAQFFCFRTRIRYADKSAQSRRISGPAVIVSNHTSVYDYAVWLFVFFGRTLRVPMAEVLFEKRPLGGFLRAMGGIRIDRASHSLAGLGECESILEKGGTVLIFPEGRIPLKDEERPLPFRYGAAALALASGAPVIPVFTNGSYFRKKRAEVVIGTPVYAGDLCDPEKSDSENLEAVSAELRRRVADLEKLLTVG